MRAAVVAGALANRPCALHWRSSSPISRRASRALITNDGRSSAGRPNAAGSAPSSSTLLGSAAADEILTTQAHIATASRAHPGATRRQPWREFKRLRSYRRAAERQPSFAERTRRNLCDVYARGRATALAKMLAAKRQHARTRSCRTFEDWGPGR